MKIVKKITFLFSILFVMLFNSVVGAISAPESLEVYSTHLIKSSDYFYDLEVIKNTFYKVTTDGEVVYCADYDLAPPPLRTSGTTASYVLRGEADAKYAYIMMNGHPKINITSSHDKNYLITALSIWYVMDPSARMWTYFDVENGTYGVNPPIEIDVIEEMGKLIAGAENYAYTNPTLSLSFGQNESVGDDYITIEGSGTVTGMSGTYTVNLDDVPSGAYVTDMSGNRKTTFNSGEHFLVNVPVSEIESLYSGIEISATATGEIGKAYWYDSVDATYQDIIALYTDDVEVSDTATYNMDKPNKVKISKRDATTGEELPGATLTIKDSNGNVIDTWVSTDEVHVIDDIEPGTYTLIETIAPEGYILTTESVEFEIKGDGSVTEVIMLNETTVVKITKVDIATSKELPGAKLTIKDSTGKVVESWTSTDKAHVITGLKPGKYILLEEIAPEGYELMETEIEFTIGEDGKVAVGKTVMKDNTIIFENSPEPEQVETGNTVLYVAIAVGVLALGTTVFIVMKRNKKTDI